MPLVNTTETYQTVHIPVDHEIGLHFVCPNCGQDSGWLDRKVSVTAEYTGLQEQAERLAQQKAEVDLEEVLKGMTAENMMQILGEPVKCPHCGAIQLSGNAEQTVSRKGCLPFLAAGILIVLAVAIFLFTNLFPKDQTSIILVAGCGVALGIGLLIWYAMDSKRRLKLAKESPQAELKYLGAVHNNAIDVDFRQRGPGGIVTMTPAPVVPDEDDE